MREIPRPEFIPILDISEEINTHWDELMDAIQHVLRSNQFIMGPQVAAFENRVADYLKVKHAIGVNSGTDALVIGLKALGIGQGDEVITTPFTFFATAEAISHLGATPVFVDIEPNTFNMDVTKLEAAITSSTKAIIPVHLFGQACNMSLILQIANQYGLKVVEDVAQAFGGKSQMKSLGTIGHIGCFSFFPSKNLGAYGDGGLIATNDDQLADYCRMLRAHGSKKKYHNERIGYNSRLDEIQAAFLNVKLPYVDQWNEKRREIAAKYNTLLANVKGIVTPLETKGNSHVFHQYTLRVEEGRRDSLLKGLNDAGIQTMVYYPIPVHQLPVYKAQARSLPVAEKSAKEVLSLPIWPQIKLEQQERVAAAIKKIMGDEQIAVIEQ